MLGVDGRVRADEDEERVEGRGGEAGWLGEGEGQHRANEYTKSDLTQICYRSKLSIIIMFACVCVCVCGWVCRCVGVCVCVCVLSLIHI